MTCQGRSALSRSLSSFLVSISKESAPACLQRDSWLMVQKVEGVCSKKLELSSLVAIWASTQPGSAEFMCCVDVGKIK